MRGERLLAKLVAQSDTDLAGGQPEQAPGDGAVKRVQRARRVEPFHAIEIVEHIRRDTGFDRERIERRRQAQRIRHGKPAILLAVCAALLGLPRRVVASGDGTGEVRLVDDVADMLRERVLAMDIAGVPGPVAAEIAAQSERQPHRLLIVLELLRARQIAEIHIGDASRQRVIRRTSRRSHRRRDRQECREAVIVGIEDIAICGDQAIEETILRTQIEVLLLASKQQRLVS